MMRFFTMHVFEVPNEQQHLLRLQMTAQVKKFSLSIKRYSLSAIISIRGGCGHK